MATFKSNCGSRPRHSGALWLLLAAPLLFAPAGDVGASEVVDLRVGSHPEFTRIVFELDTPTGYRIERASPEPGVSELVVAIDATSIPRKIQSTRSLIGLVRIQPEGDRSVAYIRLTRSGLRLKEMILASPPRIVLDVLAPPGSVEPSAADKAAKAKKATKAKVQVKVQAKEPKPSVPPVVARTQKPAAGPSPVAPTAEPKPAAQSAGERDEPEPAPPSFGARRGAQPSEPSEGGIPSMGTEPEKLAAAAPSGAQSRPPATARPRQMGRSAAPAARGGSSAKPSRTPPARPTRKLPPAPIGDSSSSGMGSAGIAIAVVGLLALVAFVVVRRRRAADDEEAEEEFEQTPADDGNPFASLVSQSDSQPVLSTGGSSDDEGEAATREMEIGGMGAAEQGTEVAGLDEVEPVLKGADMEFDGAETVVAGLDTAPASGGVASEPGGSEEEMRMIRELERRLASLETRLDEVVDARERLERQVAAQTEELRVQRAAIARTQRAVRNLSRPEEDGATEPAPREP